MRALRSSLALLFAALLCAAPLRAQPEILAPWTELVEAGRDAYISGDTIVVVDSGFGIDVSTDGGATFDRIDLQALTDDRFNENTDLALRGDTFYVGAFNSGGGLFRTDGDLRTWVRDDAFLDRAPNSTRTQDVRAVFSDQGTLVLFADEVPGSVPSIYASVDGASWARTAPVPEYAYLGYRNGRLFAGSGDLGLVTSDDLGLFFDERTPGWDSDGAPRFLAFGEGDDVYVVSYASALQDPRLLYSADGGDTWTNIIGQLPIPDGAFLTDLQAQGNRVFVSVRDLTVFPDELLYTSTDRGATWALVGPAPRIRINPAITDDGGLAGGIIDGDFFYADVVNRFNGFSLARIPLAETTLFMDTASDSAQPMGADLALSVAPNPVRGTARVRLTATNAAPARVEVFDLLGRQVLALPEVVAPVGEATLTLDAGRLTAGTYVVRAVQADAVTQCVITIVR
ncbi:MAG: T9SS type A sorting domain-containing protein [Bacteroidota bacterium]